MPLKLCLIVAACENMGIGYNGELPWKLTKEMTYFSRMTKGVDTAGKMNAVIMGRRTWESIPERNRPLQQRLNIVLTRSQMSSSENVLLCSDWAEAMNELQKPERLESIEKVWVIGGSSVYKTAMDSPHCHRIYLSRILATFNCDVFIPPIDMCKFQLVKGDPQVPSEEEEENGIRVRYEVYERV